MKSFKILIKTMIIALINILKPFQFFVFLPFLIVALNKNMAK